MSDDFFLYWNTFPVHANQNAQTLNNTSNSCQQIYQHNDLELLWGVYRIWLVIYDLFSLCFQSPELIESLKDKLKVPQNGYRFSRAGLCEVCDTHVSQLQQEAIGMVHSIQQAQSETSTTNTNLPNLIGSVNLPPLPRQHGSSKLRWVDW